MDPAQYLEQVELTEAKAAERKNTHWEPTVVANNINRSLRSLETIYSANTSLYGDEETIQNQGPNFFENDHSENPRKKTANDYDLSENISLLDPSESLPALPSTEDKSVNHSSSTNQSPSNSSHHGSSFHSIPEPGTSTKSKKDSIKSHTYFEIDKQNNLIPVNPNSSSLGNFHKESELIQQSIQPSTSTPLSRSSSIKSLSQSNNHHSPKPSSNKKKSKMAGPEPEVDYGDSIRSQFMNEFPSYNSVPSLENDSAFPSHISGPITPKGLIGAVKLPFLEHSSNHKAHPISRKSSTNRKQKMERDQLISKAKAKSFGSSVHPTDVKDLSKLPVLTEDTINSCLHARFKNNLIYTLCGDVLISVNPFQNLGMYTEQDKQSYSPTSASSEPHIYMVSSRAYQDLKDRQLDQVILVSGESGSGKTEATKLLVEHLTYMSAGDATSLTDKIIQVNPLLECFGNAQTVLNKNSSRFAKFLKLHYSEDFNIHSAKIQDFVLEKSRVVYYEQGERTFHAFYALLAGASSRQDLYISPGQTFRITGDFSSLTSSHAERYRTLYETQQRVFSLINMAPEEREDVDTILAAILHVGDIEFVEADGDCVTIRNEETVQKVANLLDLDREKLIEALIERRGNIRGTTIKFSKKRRQANDERDALAKTLYEKLFGWIVRKINDALTPQFVRNAGSVGILDICGFEDLQVNSFEQICINIINEHLQNFMNKKIIEDEKILYEEEGIYIGNIDTSASNNDAILDMFMKKPGILASIDEDSKHEISSDDTKMVRKLDSYFGKEGSAYVPSVSNRPEFTIRHFAGNVKYDGRGFITKNRDVLGELVEDCLKHSNSLLVKDLFHVQPSFTGSISMSPFKFQGSRRGGQSNYRPLTDNNLSETINKSTRQSLRSKFGSDMPSFKADFSNKKSHIHYFKNSLQELKRNMANANPFFVRCIKSNDRQLPAEYDTRRVGNQLRYNGVTEIARIRSCAFPVRMVLQDFVKRYGELVPEVKYHHVEEILQTVTSQPDQYSIGNSQVFMASQIQLFLEDDLAELRKKQEEERLRLEEEKRRQEEIKRRKEEAEREERERERGNLFPTKSILKGTTNRGFRMEDITEVSTPSSSPTQSSAYNQNKFTSSTDWDESYSDNSSAPTTSTTLRATKNNDMEKDDENTEVKSQDKEKPYNGRMWEDVFQTLEDEVEHEDIINQRLLRLTKAFLFAFLALLLLASLVVQKVSFITLVMELRKRISSVEQISEREINDRRTVAYIMLIIILCIPHAVGFIISMVKLMFSISKSPSVWTWLWVLFMESLHTFGLCLLVFRVMPQLDYFKVIYMMSMTAVFPAFLKLVTSDRKVDFATNARIESTAWKVSRSVGILFDVIAFGMQVAGIVLIFEFDFYKANEHSNLEILEMVCGLVLVSFNQWENFSDGTFFGKELNDVSWFKNRILKMRFELQECRHYPNSVCCLLKIGLTVLCAYLLSEGVSFDYEASFHQLSIHAKTAKSISSVVAVTIAAFVAFNTALLSLKLQMQRFSFALPLYLASAV